MSKSINLEQVRKLISDNFKKWQDEYKPVANSEAREEIANLDDFSVYDELKLDFLGEHIQVNCLEGLDQHIWNVVIEIRVGNVEYCPFKKGEERYIVKHNNKVLLIINDEFYLVSRKPWTELECSKKIIIVDTLYDSQSSSTGAIRASISCSQCLNNADDIVTVVYNADRDYANEAYVCPKCYKLSEGHIDGGDVDLSANRLPNRIIITLKPHINIF